MAENPFQNIQDAFALITRRNIAAQGKAQAQQQDTLGQLLSMARIQDLQNRPAREAEARAQALKIAEMRNAHQTRKMELDAEAKQRDADRLERMATASIQLKGARAADITAQTPGKVELMGAKARAQRAGAAGKEAEVAAGIPQLKAENLRARTALADAEAASRKLATGGSGGLMGEQRKNLELSIKANTAALKQVQAAIKEDKFRGFLFGDQRINTRQDAIVLQQQLIDALVRQAGKAAKLGQAEAGDASLSGIEDVQQTTLDEDLGLLE